MAGLLKGNFGIAGIISVLLILLLVHCESQQSGMRPAFEKPRFIIKLKNTSLLVSEVVRDLEEPWEIAWDTSGLPRRGGT